LLPENELDSLIHYVRYLSIRGEVERLLIDYVATELDPKDPMYTVGGPETSEKKTEQIAALKSFATEVTQKWIDAETQAVEVPPPDPNRDLAKSEARGKELFYGPIANCIKCHGDSALGDGVTNDYDDWTKELEPANPTAVNEYLHAGALPPRNIRPRNLRLGVYRGGRRPMDLYWRLRNGIEGTPMPAVPLKPDDAGPEVKGLTNSDIWNLIDYVRSLPHDPISKPTMEQTVSRERL
jgi:mono/diheme cytochrome c family protein